MEFALHVEIIVILVLTPPAVINAKLEAFPTKVVAASSAKSQIA